MRTMENNIDISRCRSFGNFTLKRHDSKEIIAETTNVTSRVHQLQLNNIDRQPNQFFTVKVELCNWSNIEYLALGVVSETKTFHHVKIKHPLQGFPITHTVRFDSLIYKIQNNGVPYLSKSNNLKIYIKGDVGNNAASVSISEVRILEHPRAHKTRSRHDVKVSLSVIHSIYSYWTESIPKLTEKAESYVNGGDLFLSKAISIPFDESQTDWNLIRNNKSISYSWHSLKSVSILLTAYTHTGSVKFLLASHQIVTIWIKQFGNEFNQEDRYIWYDHATAERLMALIIYYYELKRVNFISGHFTLIEDIILGHSRLLATEAFYAANQPFRYHNHAVFQDLALYLSANSGIFKGNEPIQWDRIALYRLKDQLSNLLIKDSNCSILCENSLAYHQGMTGIVAILYKSIMATKSKKMYIDIFEEMRAFANQISYPNGTQPSNGNSFRSLQKKRSDNIAISSKSDFSVQLFKKAGYGIVKGRVNQHNYQLNLYSSCKSLTHKHMDDLSLTLYYAGVEWLIDPSYYNHDYAKEGIAAYLRSSAAHNRITLLEDLHCEPTKTDYSSLSLSVENDGYCFVGENRFNVKTQISRMVEVREGRQSVKVSDKISNVSGNEPKGFLALHFAPGTKIRLANNVITATHEHSVKGIKLLFDCRFSPQVIEAEMNHPIIKAVTGLGFEQTHPITSVLIADIPANYEFIWTIELL